MTRRLFISVILGISVLVLGAQSALAGGPDVTSMIQAREKALGRDFQLGDFAVNNTWRERRSPSASTSMIRAREKALGRDFQLGDFAVNNTWRERLSPSASTSMIQAREKALGRHFQLGDFAVNNTWRGASAATSSSELQPLKALMAPSAQGSGDEIEWPTIGVGFAVGLVLVLGLALILKATHTRPFAH